MTFSKNQPTCVHPNPDKTRQCGPGLELMSGQSDINVLRMNKRHERGYEGRMESDNSDIRTEQQRWSLNGNVCCQTPDPS